MTKSVAEKMGVQPGMRAYLLNAPSESITAMHLPPLEIHPELTGMFDYIHYFALNESDLDARLPELKAHLVPTGKLWVSWPKARQLGTDLSIKNVIKIGYNHGLVESVNLRIDDTWTALKFTWPKPGKRYHNSYGKLPD